MISLSLLNQEKSHLTLHFSRSIPGIIDTQSANDRTTTSILETTIKRGKKTNKRSEKHKNIVHYFKKFSNSA